MLTVSLTDTTDAGFAYLTPLRNLRALFLHSTKITEAGLPLLQCFPQLEELWIGGTFVTDAGLPHLYGLATLRRLDLTDDWADRKTLVTAGGVAKLQQALPELAIER